MRIPKTWVPPLAKKILDTLVEEELAEPAIAKEKLLEAMEAIIMEELSVEDRVNDEVREVLKKYETEIAKGRLDYRKLFDLTKQKLVKESNIVI